MREYGFVLTAFAVFILLQLAAAWWAERTPLGRRCADGPVAYSLALGVYCTSWTFYGSVGSAASSGPLFLAIYLGPTLLMFFAGTFLRRMVAFARERRTGNIADFVAASYGGSQFLGVLVTLMAVVAITPYLALQLKSIVATFALLIGETPGHSARHDAAGPMIALLVVLTIVLGLRTVDSAHRHRGVTMVLVVQSLIKLGSFLACGWFVVYGLFDGGHDLMQRYVQAQAAGPATVPNTIGASWYMSFSTLLVLSMAAFFLLPRMFQTLIVENMDENHLRTASWLFPLYLFLINLFVLPIAVAGLIQGWGPQDADTFVLRLPIAAHADGLALMVFLGGFSGAMGMVVVGTMAISTMVSNYLLLPFSDAAPAFGFIRRYLLQLRWLVVAALVYVAYLFQDDVGTTQFLISMGMVSFAGFAQLLPAVVGGLLWRSARRSGAIAGIGIGFVLWAYTLFLPLVARSGWQFVRFELSAPFGIGWLHAEHLFGMQALPPLVHGTFWSLLANTFAYVLVSIFSAARTAENAGARLDGEAGEMVEALPMAGVRRILRDRLQEFLEGSAAQSLLAEAERSAGISGLDQAQPIQVARFLSGAEAGLAASIGAAAARRVFAVPEILEPAAWRSVQRAYSETIAELNISPEELRERVDFFEERKTIAETYARKLESTVEERTQELSGVVVRLQDSNLQLTATQEDLSRKGEEMRSLLNNLRDGVITIDARGIIQGVNPAISSIFGYPADALRGQNLVMLIPPEMRPRHEAGLARHVETGEGRLIGTVVELEGLRADGSRVPIDLSINAYAVRGERFYTGILRDSTLRRQTEAVLHANLERLTEINRKLEEAQNQLLQSEKMASIGQLAAGVAHEINNPIGFVNSNLGSLRSQVQDLLTVLAAYRNAEPVLAGHADLMAGIEQAKAAADLEFLQEDIESLIAESIEGVQRVKKIVEDLKDFSRIDTAEWQFANLERGLDSTLNIVRNEVKYKAEVKKEYAGLPEIECIASQMNQVFMNLLVNAAHAIENRGIVTLRTGFDETSVWVEIEDTGQGILPEHLDRIFEPFFTTKPVGKGTGLGLSLAYSIVQRHHGKIEARSQAGQGSVFRVTLPRQRVAEAAPDAGGNPQEIDQNQ